MRRSEWRIPLVKLIPSTELLFPLSSSTTIVQLPGEAKTPTQGVWKVLGRLGLNLTSLKSQRSNSFSKEKNCRDFSPEKDEKFLIPPHQNFLLTL